MVLSTIRACGLCLSGLGGPMGCAAAPSVPP
nr:MAG TPA: hypothetical protein [Caudoviricetes sp.]